MFVKFISILSIINWVVGCTTLARSTNSKPQDVIITYSTDEFSAFNSTETPHKKWLQNYQEELEDQLKRTNHSMLLNLELAKTKLLRADLEATEKLAKSVLRFDLKNSKAKKLLATVYLQKGEPGLASLILENLRVDNERDPEILNLLAISAYSQKDFLACFENLEAALNIDEQFLAARLNLAALYLEFNEFNNATIQLERILKIDNQNVDAMLQMATIKSIQGDFDAARAIYNNVLDKHEELPLARINWVMFNKRIGNYDVAIESLESYQDKKNSQASKQQLATLLNELKQERDALNQKTSDEDIKRLANELRLKNSEQVENDGVPESGLGL